jgi:hypothetical protein
MTPRRLLIAALLVAASVAAVIGSTRGPPPPSASPAGTFSFAALGDSPYSWYEDLQYRVVLEDLASHDLSFVVHVGDILDSPCTDERYRRTLDEFNALPHPVVYTPGDNEWADCWSSGDFAPLDRLARIREMFFDDADRSLGGRQIALERQSAQAEFGEFPENARWEHRGVVFATLHLVGSWNGTASRMESSELEAERRLNADVAWLRATFAVARESDAAAVVVAFHANPAFDEPDAARRDVYDRFIAALEEEVEGVERPVLAIHGDWHEYTVDHPLTSRATNRSLGTLTRLQVPGSYDVGWVRITVRPGAAEPFTFEPRVVPRWKYW